MAKKKYNFIDLFCGAGGFAKGFEMTNKFQCIGGIDNKQSAIETHKLNFKKSVSICDDIRNISPSEFNKLLNGQEVDLIIGGPPCPTFSTIGHAKIQSVNKNDINKSFKTIEEMEIWVVVNLKGVNLITIRE